MVCRNCQGIVSLFEEGGQSIDIVAFRLDLFDIGCSFVLCSSDVVVKCKAYTPPLDSRFTAVTSKPCEIIDIG